jgi:hypothetical protein
MADNRLAINSSAATHAIVVNGVMLYVEGMNEAVRVMRI